MGSRCDGLGLATFLNFMHRRISIHNYSIVGWVEALCAAVIEFRRDAMLSRRSTHFYELQWIVISECLLHPSLTADSDL